MVFNLFRRTQRPAEALADSGGVGLLEAPAEPPVRAEPLEASGFVTYSWLLDPKKHIIGYRMGWRAAAGQPPATPEARIKALLRVIAPSFVHRQRGWCLGKLTLLFDVTPGALRLAEWKSLPARNIVLCCQAQDFADPALLPAFHSLREEGYGLMLCGAADAPADKAVCELATHFDVGAADPLLMATCRSLSKRPPHPIATRMESWPAFEACAARRVPVLVSPAQESPRANGPRQPLQPESVLIVRLLQMLQRNEDVREIEAALKHDAALTYRLLRHINSPAVGAGVEIESLRHAVAMLGYSRLFRWLSLLLATSDAKSSPPFLMKKAIMRGRFVELLGQALLGPRHSDNLFLVGMFSVIDQVLGIPMTELLEKVQLAEPVQTAILERRGMYGPLLALALACGSDDGDAGRLSEELFMSADQVNTAHLEAIAWSQEISRSDALY
jgi:c-di-GMP-related signal transduction protein